MVDLKKSKVTVELTPEQMEWIDDCTNSTWRFNILTGEVDVVGSFDCSDQELSDFKGIRFGKIGGSFYCGNNRLTSLVGAPKKVGGSFYCGNNRLTSLVGAPKKVGGSFHCGDNQLTSLVGAPQELKGGGFSCSNNQLTTLVGAPEKVGESFHCMNNQLTSLGGAPLKVGGSFSCENNQLTSLEGAHRRIGEYFYCDSNPVSENTLWSIFFRMKKGGLYLKAVESLWSDIPVKDQALLYRPEFGWVGEEERRKLDALRAYQEIKNML